MREYFVWEVLLQREDGTKVTYRVRNLWDPQKISVDDIKGAAMAEAKYITGQTHAPLSAKLIGKDGEEPTWNPRDKAKDATKLTDADKATLGRHS